MPKFNVTVLRDYVERESVDVAVKADTPEAALAAVRGKLEADECAFEHLFVGDGGRVDRDSYAFKVRDPEGEIVLSVDDAAVDADEEETRPATDFLDPQDEFPDYDDQGNLRPGVDHGRQ